MSAPSSTLLSLAQTGVKSVADKMLEAAPILAALFGSLIGAIMIGCIVVYYIRKRSLVEITTHRDLPLTLLEVRRMHREGEIDDDEMQRLKKVITEKARRDLEPKPVEEAPEEAGEDTEEADDTEETEPETSAQDDASTSEKEA